MPEPSQSLLLLLCALTACGLILMVVILLIMVRRGKAPEILPGIIRQLDEGNRAGQQAVQIVGTQLNERIAEQTKTLNDRIAEQSQAVNHELARNREELSREFKQVRETMEARLTAIQQDNAKRLDEMRSTVDEKLAETLERRFTESFTLISQRLESVQRGLGEMQTLAGNVVDLKNVLTNVKTRGNFGEYQLLALLEDVFTPDQFETNFAPNLRSQQRVEFAVKMPGFEEPVYLPIDSKFPIENYQRLLEAYEAGDAAGVASLHTELVNQALRFARDIRDKYLNPPRTTDFGIMFVPTESLYAELMREPGFADRMRSYKTLLAGPSTLQALIVSFQVGFSSLAIEKRTSEIEQLLGAVKTEFGNFQGILESVDKRLEQARGEIAKATRKTGTIQRKLKNVTELPTGESTLLLEAGDEEDTDNAEVVVLENS